MVSSRKPTPRIGQAGFGCLAAMIGAELIYLATGWVLAGHAAQLLFVGLCLFALPWATIREKVLLGLAVAMSVVALALDGAFSDIWFALDLAAFFGSFIALLTMMKEAAERSDAVLRVGRYLTSQPPGRRFFATAIGGHVLGVFLNFGAVSLMSPLIQKSAVNADGSPSPDLERRQLSALIRGFSWVLLWAPTTLSQAVLLTVFSEVSWGDFALLGISTAGVMIVIGRAYDRFEWRNTPALPSGSVQAMPLRAACVVGGVCTVLIGATFMGRHITGGSIAQVLMFVTPIVTLVWFVLQAPARLSVAVIASRIAAFGPIMHAAAPALARSAMALGLSGFIGRLAATLLPMEQIADHLNLSQVPGWLFLATLPVLITLGGQIALSPILLVVFLGEVLNNVADLPTGDVNILFALSAGWALSMTASPNATATLLISSVCRVPPTTLTWRWNLRYGLICYGVFVLVFAVIA